mmetsp:Transcript_59952/g.170521  ORF Transcript_59952/g.170521 Transcript_59952/m.170521 type:complete len:305 (+) Transcript_59952:497-1411(+)
MATGHLAGDMVVDAAVVVLEVAVDGEGGLNGPPGHDHLLDLLLARCMRDLAGEGVLVLREGLVRDGCIAIAGLGARGRLLVGAARLALSGVRVAALRAVVVAVRQGVVRAVALAEGAGALVLPARHHAVLLDVAPRRVDHPTAAAVVARAEADVLGRKREEQGAVRGNAHAIGRSLHAGEGPAAAAVGLVLDVVDGLGTLRPVRRRVEALRDHEIGPQLELPDLALLDRRPQLLPPALLHTTESLGGTRRLRGEPGDRRCAPQHTGRALDLLDLREPILVHASRRGRNAAEGCKEQRRHREGRC